MSRVAEEIAVTDRFERQYEYGRSTILRDIERDICGCDYGGTSWTTRREAEQVSRLLRLSPGKFLADIGSGSGWPALYMATISGCDAVLIDVPVTGIRAAVDRAANDGIAKSCRAVVGDGCALPLRSVMFHAISHSDVLCCLRQKADLLRECRRVVRKDGAMAFTVIELAPDHSPERKARAIELGPPFMESECDYSEMLENSGWRLADCIDLSSEYARSTQRFVEAWKNSEVGVKSVVGAEEFNDFIIRKGASIPYIEGGTISRRLYAAVPSI